MTLIGGLHQPELNMPKGRKLDLNLVLRLAINIVRLVLAVVQRWPSHI